MTKLNPLKILLVWIILMTILTPILLYKSGAEVIGGQPKFLTNLIALSTTTMIGATIICITTLFIYKSWLKSNKWFAILTIFLLLSSALFLWEYFSETPYGFAEEVTEINGSKIKIKTEYYNTNDKTIRSKSFWKNDKKDSIWTVFTKDGRVISKKVYRNDSLIEIK